MPHGKSSPCLSISSQDISRSSGERSIPPSDKTGSLDLSQKSARRPGVSSERRKQINRDSARRIRAKKLAEASRLRQEIVDQQRTIRKLRGQIASLRAENTELLKQNTSLMQQNMSVREDLHTCISNNVQTQISLPLRSPRPTHSSSLLTEGDLLTPPAFMPTRSLATSGSPLGQVTFPSSIPLSGLETNACDTLSGLELLDEGFGAQENPFLPF